MPGPLGEDYSFKLSEADFKSDTHDEYDAFNISVPTVMSLYGRVGPTGHGQPNVSCGCGSPQLSGSVCVPCKYPGRYSPWWWSVIERGSDFGFHCTSREFAKQHGKTNSVFLHSYKVQLYPPCRRRLCVQLLLTAFAQSAESSLPYPMVFRGGLATLISGPQPSQGRNIILASSRLVAYILVVACKSWRNAMVPVYAMVYLP